MGRSSRHRDLILQILRSTDRHPTAEEVHVRAKQEFPHIGLATVYRNLKALRDHGEVLELTFGMATSRFDARTDPHYHFVCCGCEGVFDVPMPVDDRLEKRARLIGSFEILQHQVLFFGLCNECR